jgi:hypothetical protein
MVRERDHGCIGIILDFIPLVQFEPPGPVEFQSGLNYVVSFAEKVFFKFYGVERRDNP